MYMNVNLVLDDILKYKFCVNVIASKMMWVSRTVHIDARAELLHYSCFTVETAVRKNCVLKNSEHGE